MKSGDHMVRSPSVVLPGPFWIRKITTDSHISYDGYTKLKLLCLRTDFV